MHIFVYIKIYIHVHRIREHPHFFFWLICINVNAQRGKFTSTVMPNKPVGFAGTQGGRGRGKRERLWYNSICPPPQKKETRGYLPLYTEELFPTRQCFPTLQKPTQTHQHIYVCARTEVQSQLYKSFFVFLFASFLLIL